MRILPPLWSAAALGLNPSFEEGLQPFEITSPLFISGGGNIGGAPRDLDPSLTSVFTPQTRLHLAKLLGALLDRLAAKATTERLRTAPRVLIEKGLSNGHFDPSFWLIDAWFGRRDRNRSLLTQPARTLALAHFQKGPIQVTREEAARWIAVNVLMQKVAMETGRWPFVHSRRLDLFTSRTGQANEYWRSDGSQGGLWFYPREVFRDDSSHGRWLVIAAIPEPFVYHFTALDQSGAVVVPGPLPPRSILRQGPTGSVMEELNRHPGGAQAYLLSIENPTSSARSRR
jgi:hypothetical protein